MCRMFIFFLGLLALLAPALGRRTLAGCKVKSNVTIFADVAAAQVQYGAASALTAGLAHPWPETIRHGRRVRVMTYCFTNQYVKDKLDCPVTRALDAWRNKLDSPGFHGTTNLIFSEASDGAGNSFFCFDGNGQWNWRHVLRDTLWIEIHDGMSGEGEATVGYDVSSASHPHGFHKMILGNRVVDSVVVHEFGHVFGLVHEHQRNDRDDHLLFNCKGIRGYDETVRRARVEHKLSWEDAHKKLCEDEDFARSYNFPSTEFIKSRHGRVHDEATIPFDLDSVMMYSSEVFGNRGCHADVARAPDRACPLLRYRTYGGLLDKSIPPLKIPVSALPSDGDARFIQRWYPRT